MSSATARAHFSRIQEHAMDIYTSEYSQLLFWEMTWFVDCLKNIQLNHWLKYFPELQDIFKVFLQTKVRVLQKNKIFLTIQPKPDILPCVDTTSLYDTLPAVCNIVSSIWVGMNLCSLLCSKNYVMESYLR